MPEKRTRRLAAIMFADMTGYTALMQENEEEARAQRDRHRTILSAAVGQNNGEVLQYYGDGTLSIFSSAVEAVECAVQVQLELKGEALIPLRIGVHTGDIVHDEDGVYGDGVNVASRIEGLAAPGGVMVSGKVFDEIKNHRSISTISMGAVQLKNVEHQVNLFAISNEGLAVPTEAQLRKESFLQRIKDRAMLPWVLAYMAGAWALLEVVGFGAEQFSWPSMVPRGLALVAFAGFFLTIVLAWYHGEKGRQKASGPELLIIALLFAITGGALSVLGPGGPGLASSDRGPAVVETAARERPVIAVIPFVNMSTESEEEAAFLATGLHDELLTQLSKIASLDVIARTSVMQYAGTEKTIPVIGRELGAHTVLEGTLLRAGDQIRLNIQLIDTETDTHIWADTYDREFTVANVFAIQSDLAHQVVLALRAELVPAEQALIAEVPTQDWDAYALYLRGREALDRPGLAPADLEAAQTMFNQATEADPEFALAHAWVSIAQSTLHRYYDRSEARLDQALEAADESLRLSPELPEGHFAKAFYHFQRYENEEAAQALARAEQGLPGSTDVLTLKGELLIRQGDWDATLAIQERTALLDPRNPEAAMSLATAYADRDRWDEANAVFDRILETHPTFFEAAFIRGYLTWRRTGDGEPGLAALARVPPEVEVFGLKLFFEWLMTAEVEGKISALERLDHPILDFGGFWWAPRELLEGWTYKDRDPVRAERAFEVAVERCQEALESQPGDPRIHASLGRAYAGLGRREEAIREAERVMEILPITVDPVYGRDLLEIAAIIYAELGMAEEAADALDEVLSVPRVPPMSSLTGWEFERIRDHPRIQALIEHYGVVAGGSIRAPME
jgi:TolB-like protein/class 3 adenylate cyclase/Flp pilus assembly protein TadD